MRGAWAFAFIAGFGLAVRGRQPPSIPFTDRFFFPVEMKGGGCVYTTFMYTCPVACNMNDTNIIEQTLKYELGEFTINILPHGNRRVEINLLYGCSLVKRVICSNYTRFEAIMDAYMDLLPISKIIQDDAQLEDILVDMM